MGHPIYLLTGDLETAKFFASLASSTCRMGNFVQDRITHKIMHDVGALPKLNGIGESNLFGLPDKYVIVKALYKQFKIEPDFIVVDEVKKTIDVFELKVNLSTPDSKKVYGEISKYAKLQEYLKELYSKYTIQTYAIDFIGDGGGSSILYQKSGIFKIINGRQFCDIVHIDYGDVMDDIKENRKSNLEYIKRYKFLPLEGTV